MIFKKASRSAAKIKLAITGPSGSGKTFSSLMMAKGLGAKIAVIDTENGSASLYSDKMEFDTLSITPPYSTEKYIQAIDAAVSHGYDCLVIDSITHAWSGEGGLLAQKEQIDSRGGNSYTNWAKITQKHEAFMAKILNSPIHLIATMRSKQDYVMSDKNGKQVPQKVGMAPIQRDGAEYEFTVVFDIAMNHEALASKDRTGLFDSRIFKINEATGKELASWLDSAEKKSQTIIVKNDSIEKVGSDQQGQPGLPFRVPESIKENLQPGEYVAKVGKTAGPIKGKKLKDINPTDLDGFLTYLMGKDPNNKPTSRFLNNEDTQEFMQKAAAFLDAKENDGGTY